MLKKILTIFVLNILTFGWLLIPVSSQSFTNKYNPISLKITNVLDNGEIKNTNGDDNDWSYNNSLKIGDEIRYRWNGIDLNTKYKNTPALGGGYLKIYLNEVNDSNFLLDQGTDNYPLKISSIASKLKNGENKLQFVYVASSNNTAYSPVSFTFKYQSPNSEPKINIIKPATDTVFMKDLEQDIVLELNNFQLSTNSNSNITNVGRVQAYFDKIDKSNLLGTFNTSIEKDGKFYVNSKSTELNFNNVPDNQNTKLIFVLTDTNDKILNIKSEVSIKTNFNSTIDVGLPSIKILEPKRDVNNLKIDGNTNFIIQVNNFDVLKQRNNLSNEIVANSKKGYLQIIINNGDISQPVQPIWPNKEFTLNSIGYNEQTESQITIKVQLVDENFELLKPKAEDSIEVFFNPKNSENIDNNSIDIQNQTWRTVIIVLTIILVVGGIILLATKG